MDEAQQVGQSSDHRAGTSDDGTRRPSSPLSVGVADETKVKQRKQLVSFGLIGPAVSSPFLL